jgi:hypothetical protein
VSHENPALGAIIELESLGLEGCGEEGVCTRCTQRTRNLQFSVDTLW